MVLLGSLVMRTFGRLIAMKQISIPLVVVN